MKRLAFLAAVTCLLGCAFPDTGRAGPEVVYSTFGEPGDTFANGVGFAVAGSGSIIGGYDAQANSFKPSATVKLDSIRFAFFNDSDGFQIDAVIAADANGAPGAALETFSSIVALTRTSSILTENSVTHPELDAGTTYWLVLQPHDPASSAFGSWNQSHPLVAGGNANKRSVNGAWQSFTIGFQNAFDIRGTAVTQAVPEPGTLTLLGVGAAGLVASRWRRRARA